MSLFDAIKGELMKSVTGLLGGATPADAAGGASGDLPATLIDQVMGLVRERGVGAIVDQFRKHGMGEIADSWVGTGPNQEVAGDQVRQALSPELIGGLAAKLGIDPKLAEGAVATLLPRIVDRLTPQGRLPDADPGA